MTTLTVKDLLPEDGTRGALVGRVWRPRGWTGRPWSPCAATASSTSPPSFRPSARPLREAPIRPGARRDQGRAHRRSRRASSPTRRRTSAIRQKPWLLAPLDLQAVKAAGVTFAISMLERVIEERARGASGVGRGHPRRGDAADRRRSVEAQARLGPGDAAEAGADRAERLWSQYLEVGIGPDAEVFTKAPPLSAVGTGVDAGLHPKSTWNNPEPEVVLVVVEPAATSSARRSATTSTCATSRAARRCCCRRPRTTTPPARSGRSLRLFDDTLHARRRAQARDLA